MMSLSTIRQLSRDAAIRSVRENRIPFTVEPEDLIDWKRRLETGTLKLPFPFLGDYVPNGFRRTERDPLFCDHSGCGTASEPALTVRALLDALTPGKAYAVIETAQFQLFLGEFERGDDAPGNEDHFTGLTSEELQEFETEFADVPDVEVSGMPCGDLAFNPVTENALRWIKSYMFGTPQSCAGERGVLVVEARYASYVMRNMQSDGLRVRWRSN